MITIPFVAYNIFNFNSSELAKTRLKLGIFMQLIFTLLNYKFSREFMKQEEEMQWKYLSFLPESALINFSN